MFFCFLIPKAGGTNQTPLYLINTLRDLFSISGEHRYYFLSLDRSNRIELKHVLDSNYPDDTLFRIEEME